MNICNTAAVYMTGHRNVMSGYGNALPVKLSPVFVDKCCAFFVCAVANPNHSNNTISGAVMGVGISHSGVCQVASNLHTHYG